VVDKTLLARKVAAVRDALERIQGVLPDREAFLSDRTAREVVTLNLFVALQECLALASHWLADAGWDVPESYREVFQELADHRVIPGDLAERLSAASGLRNLVAHQYGVIDWGRIHEIASSDLPDLRGFCEALAKAADADQ